MARDRGERDLDGAIRLRPSGAAAGVRDAFFEAAFNTGSAEILDTVYEPDAVFVRRDGVRVSGAERRAATATDVAKRGEDGLWRYVIDNPFGIAAP
ncbi:hypothetical protein [Amycolatopsis japonica]